MTSEVSDAVLMDRIANGDSGALGHIYDEHGGLVYSLVLRVIADREIAEDIVQETFLRAWRQASSFYDVKGSLRTWLLRIARNLAIDELRKRSVRPQGVEADTYLETLQSHDVEPSEQVSRTMQRESVATALQQLPVEQRRVLELAYFSGLSGSEIAAKLGDPLGTVKTRMRLGLQKMKLELLPDETGAIR